MRGALAILLLATSPAALAADPLGLMDYRALFDSLPQHVETDAQGNAVLVHPDGPRITRFDGPDGPEHTGVDMNPGGAIGCVTQIVLDTLSFDAICPAFLDEPRRAALQARAGQLAAAYGASLVPERPGAEVLERLHDRARAQAEAWQAAAGDGAGDSAGTGAGDSAPGDSLCQTDPQGANILRMLTDPAMAATMDAILQPSRPPVAAPCL